MTLRDYREKKGIKICDVAAALNVACSLVSMWENGQRTPNLKRTIELAKLYKVKPLKFIKEIHGDKLDV